MLESNLWSDNVFVTLTYTDEFLPRLEDGRGNLIPKDMQDWLKNLRSAYFAETGNRIRFYGVGEYGELSERPHFHLILFNFPNCLFGQSRYRLNRVNCCKWCDMVRDTWRKGNVLLAEFNIETAQYTCGYGS